MSSAPRSGGNLAALALTRVVIAVSGVLANLALIEVLPRETFGAYKIIGSTVAIVAFAASLGLGHWLNREVARYEGAAVRHVAAVLRLTLALSTLTTMGIVGWFVLTRPGDPDMWLAGALGGAMLACNALGQVHQGVIHGSRRMFLEVGPVTVGRLLAALSQVALAWTGFGLVALYAARACAALVQMLGMHWQVRRTFGPGMPPESGWAPHLMRVGLPFAATLFFSAISAQADIVMLGLFHSDVEVARYGAPAAVLLQLAFVANIFSRGFYPRLARLEGTPGQARQELRVLLRTLLLVSVPVAVGGAIVAEPLVSLLRGGAYADARWPFVLLVLAVPIRFASNGLGLSLTALGHQEERARLDMLGAVLNVVANLIAIPRWGAEGAAATTLLTDLALLALVAWRMRKAVGLPDLRVPILRISLAAAAMGVAVTLATSVHVLFQIVLGALVYGVASRVVGAWTPADLGRLRRV